MPTAFSEDGLAGRSQGNFLSLGWKLSLKADKPQDGQRYEYVERKLEYYHIIFSLKDFKILHQEGRGQVKNIVMEHFKGIFFQVRNC